MLVLVVRCGEEMLVTFVKAKALICVNNLIKFERFLFEKCDLFLSKVKTSVLFFVK